MAEIKLWTTDLWRPLLLLLLIITGITLYFLGLFDASRFLQWAGQFTNYWWVAAGLILIQALLFMLALPGSTLFWVVAPLYPPLTATFILVAGAALGALAAYFFSRTLSRPWRTSMGKNRIFRLLEKRSDFLTQCALRTFPGFPHSFINYSAGMLKLPLFPFLLAAVMGLSLKILIYAVTIDRAMKTSDPSQLIRTETMGPLLLLALLFIVAHFFQRRLARMDKEK